MLFLSLLSKREDSHDSELDVDYASLLNDLAVPTQSYGVKLTSTYNPFTETTGASLTASFDQSVNDFREISYLGNTIETGLIAGHASAYGVHGQYEAFGRDPEQQATPPPAEWGLYSFMQSLPVIGSRFLYNQPLNPLGVTSSSYREDAELYEGTPYPHVVEGDSYNDENVLEVAPASALQSTASLDQHPPAAGASTGLKRGQTKLVRKKRGKDGDPFASDKEKEDASLRYFILDHKHPELLTAKLASRIDTTSETNKEFSHLRYSAITAAPSTFIRDGFKLRNNLRAAPRETELLIAVTMYNEHDVLLGRTLQGIMENIKYMTAKKMSATWGEDSWKKIVVCVISDGRSKIHPRAKALMSALGCYQEGLAKSVIDEKEVQAHLFETTSLVNISSVSDTRVSFADLAADMQTNIPVQFVFCLKEKNAKKINSHRWFFQSFAKLLNPQITILLDAGTKPDKRSFFNLWREFKADFNVAGACGEIKAQTGSCTINALFNPLIGAQNFEYKTSNILDKPLESSFGFISVLPGAFSAYRWEALDIDNPDGPLDKYFKGEFLHSNEAPTLNDPDYEYKNLQKMKLTSQGIFTQNMYLAEDRILCFELVTTKKHKWVLRYVSSAIGETDVPKRLPEFILQRRRWLNGSFFAGTYSIIHFRKFLTSGHSKVRKFFLLIEFVYSIISLTVSWLALSCFFLVFRILSVATTTGSAAFRGSYELSVVFLYLYAFLLGITVLLSFGNSPNGRGTTVMFNGIVTCFGIVMIYMLFCMSWLVANFFRQLKGYHKIMGSDLTVGDIARVPLLQSLVISLLSTYFLYFLGALLFLDLWHMLWSFGWYILLSPAYTNVLNIYAFCNIHDVSWGTKGDTGSKSLGSVKLDQEKNEANSSPIPDAQEVNQTYATEMDILATSFREVLDSGKEGQADRFAFVRTAVVVLWMVTNFVLVAVVLNVGTDDTRVPSASSVRTARGLGSLSTRSDDALKVAAELAYPGLFDNNTTKSGVFLTIVLMTVMVLSLFRFLGALYYVFVLRMGVRVKSRTGI